MKSDRNNCVIHNAVSAYTENQRIDPASMGMLRKLFLAVDADHRDQYFLRSYQIIKRLGALDQKNLSLWLEGYNRFMAPCMELLLQNKITEAKHQIVAMLNWLEEK